MKTGYLFDYIIDIASQALAWNYLGDKLDVLRAAGMCGAMEISDVFTDLHDTADPDAAARAAQIMDRAADIARLNTLAFYNACDEIAGDLYTVFLCNIWRE